MGDRFMRLIVMFDLPTYTSLENREYRRFRKFLISNGFVMFQYSIYTKIVKNRSVMKYYVDRVRSNAPCNGEISVLSITEKQFNDIEVIISDSKSEVLHTSERNIFL